MSRRRTPEHIAARKAAYAKTYVPPWKRDGWTSTAAQHVFVDALRNLLELDPIPRGPT